MCSKESLLDAWIDPWMYSLVVDDISPEMCSRSPGCVPGNPCLNAWVDPWSCTLVEKDPRCVLGPPNVLWGILVWDQVVLG